MSRAVIAVLPTREHFPTVSVANGKAMAADDEDIAPPDIALDAQPLGFSFHPKHDVVAIGLITGAVELHTYSRDHTSRAMTLSHHTDSCRAVAFSESGDMLYSASSDKSLCCIDRTGAVMWHAVGAQ